MLESLSGGWGQEALEVADFGVLVLEDRRTQWINPYLLSLLQLNESDVAGSVVSENDRLATLLLGSDNPFLLSVKKDDDVWLRRKHIKTAERDIYFFYDCTDLLIIGNECRRLQHDLTDLNPKDPITGMMNYEVIVELLDGHISRNRSH